VFDDACLYLDSFGTSYTYDNKGRVIKTVDDSGGSAAFGYNSSNDLSSITTNEGTETMTYDSQHNLTKVVTADNVTTTYTYPANSYGNASKISVSSGGVTQTTEFAYTSNYNYLRSTKDALGTASYDYDANKGVLKSTTDPSGSTMTYQYNAYNDTLLAASASSSAGTESDRTTYRPGTDIPTGMVSASGTSYAFTYDDLLRPAETRIGNRTLVSNDYDRDGLISSIEFGNGNYYVPTYDSGGRVTAEKYTSGRSSSTYNYTYNNQGQVVAVQDGETNKAWSYQYTLGGQLLEARSKNQDVFRYAYNESGNLTALLAQKEGTTLSNVGYTYTADGKPNQVQLKSLGSSNTITYAYNGGMGRLSQTSHNTGSKTVTAANTYYAPGGNSSDLLSGLSYSGLSGTKNYAYTYDANGNIKTITENGTLRATYTYDGLNQLIREVTNWAGQGDQTVNYTYGAGGNLKQKVITGANAGTVNYTYGDSEWKDLLTNFNGQAISYDNAGNPTGYAGYSYSWQKGRQLASISGNGVNLTFKYNQDGLRTKKNEKEFVYSGDMLMAQFNSSGVALEFFYDHSGKALGYSGAYGTFYYLRNAQGDVIGLYDNSGNIVANYVYDSWGKLLSTTGSAAGTAGAENPIRYRGYYYDTETGLYYCQSRYYNPEWGRWVNADDVVETGNLFAYCGNNPIVNADPNGHIWAQVVGAITGAIASALIEFIVQSFSFLLKKGTLRGFRANWKKVAATAAWGALSGAFSMTKFKRLGQGLINGLIGLVRLCSHEIDKSVEICYTIKKTEVFFDGRAFGGVSSA
jgi:RHS repeat-associated protein